MSEAVSPRWHTRVSRSTGPLEDALVQLRADHDADPAGLLVLVRSRETVTHLRRLLPFPTQIEDLATFFGRCGPHIIRDEDLAPEPAVRRILADAAPTRIPRDDRDRFAAQAAEAIAILEANQIRPPWKAAHKGQEGAPAAAGESGAAAASSAASPQKDAPPSSGRLGAADLEAAHTALLAGLDRLNGEGLYASFQRVSDAATGSHRTRQRFPGLTTVALFGIDHLSPAEEAALDHLLSDVPHVAPFVRGRTEADAESHAGVTHTDGLVRWLAEKAASTDGSVEDLGDGTLRAVALADLFDLAPGARAHMPGIHIVRPGDADTEVEETASRIQQLVAEGVPPFAIGVIVPALEQYADVIRDTFLERGIAASITYRGSASSTGPGALVGSILLALDVGLDRDTVLDVAMHPLASIRDGSVGLDAHRLRDRLLARGRYPRGREGWLKAVAAVFERDRRDDDAAESDAAAADDGREAAWRDAQARLAEGFVNDLHALGNLPTAEEFLAGLRDLIGRLRVPARVAHAARRARDLATQTAAYTHVLSLIDAVDAGAAASGGADAVWARRTLGSLLRQDPVPAAHDPSFGVQVLGWRTAKGTRFQHAFVLGCTQDALPPPRRSPRLVRLLEARLGTRLALLDEGDEARFILHGIVADTAGTVTLSAPTMREDAPVPASVILAEIGEVLRLDPAPPLPDLPLPARAAARLAATTGRALAEAPAHLAAAQSLVAARSGDDRTSSFAGRIADPAALAALAPASLARADAVSASRIEAYAACPQRYLYRYALGLRVPDTREEGVDALARGAIIHRILDAYAKETMDAAKGAPARASAATRGADGERMLRIATEVLDAEPYAGVAWAAFRKSLLVGLDGRPSTGIPGLLETFLDKEALDGRVLVASEARFGDESSAAVRVDTPSGPLSLRGAIDRIDTQHAGPVAAQRDGAPKSRGGRAPARIIDYKTGHPPKLDAVEDGVAFQLPLYVLAARALHPSLDVDEAAYYAMKSPKRGDIGVPDKSRLTRADDPEAFAALVDRDTPRRLAAIVDAERGGHFGLTLLDAKNAGCAHCDFKRICGLRPHLVRAARERVMRNPAGAYVPDGFREAYASDAEADTQ